MRGSPFSCKGSWLPPSSIVVCRSLPQEVSQSQTLEETNFQKVVMMGGFASVSQFGWQPLCILWDEGSHIAVVKHKVAKYPLWVHDVKQLGDEMRHPPFRRLAQAWHSQVGTLQRGDLFTDSAFHKVPPANTVLRESNVIHCRWHWAKVCEVDLTRQGYSAESNSKARDACCCWMTSIILMIQWSHKAVVFVPRSEICTGDQCSCLQRGSLDTCRRLIICSGAFELCWCRS